MFETCERVSVYTVDEYDQYTPRKWTAAHGKCSISWSLTSTFAVKPPKHFKVAKSCSLTRSEHAN
jgi:hypothetical protein